MDQVNEADEAKQEKEATQLDHTNRMLIVGFAIVAAGAIGAYIIQFWGRPPSPDPSNWAHFATYLSGTIGVTAVVATLIVLVRTLGQQQALIDSQSKMLEKQEEQLKLTQQQVDGEERRRQVELAYNCAINIIPPVIRELEKQQETSIKVFFDKLDMAGEIPEEVDIFCLVNTLFDDNGDYEWLDQLEDSWMAVMCQALVNNAYRLGVLVSDCLYVAAELEDYFRAVIGNENFRLIKCSMLLNKNMPRSNFEQHQKSLRIVDGRQSSNVEQFWHDLGEKVYTKQPAD